MLELVGDVMGQVLKGVRVYNDDVSQYWTRIDRFDKLERIQHFREPGNASWEAFIAGDWEGAQRILDRDRSAIAAEFKEDERLGIASRRVRVVELPVTPYLQWELCVLRSRAEFGEDIRIVGPESIADYESERVVPELIFLGALAMYEVCYDAAGTLWGARKFVDSELIRGCLADLEALYRRGEPIHSFFDREIAPLPPPDMYSESAPPGSG